MQKCFSCCYLETFSKMNMSSLAFLICEIMFMLDLFCTSRITSPGDWMFNLGDCLTDFEPIQWKTDVDEHTNINLDFLFFVLWYLWNRS